MSNLQVLIDVRKILLINRLEPDKTVRPTEEERAQLEAEIAELENKLQTP